MYHSFSLCIWCFGMFITKALSFIVIKIGSHHHQLLCEVAAFRTVSKLRPRERSLFFHMRLSGWSCLGQEQIQTDNSCCALKSQCFCQREKSGRLLEVYKDRETFTQRVTASQLDVPWWANHLLRTAEYWNAKLHSVTQVFQVLIAMKGIQGSQGIHVKIWQAWAWGPWLALQYWGALYVNQVAVGRSLTDFIKSVTFPFFSPFQASCRMAICFSLSYLGVRVHCGKERFCL